MTHNIYKDITQMIFDSNFMCNYCSQSRLKLLFQRRQEERGVSSEKKLVFWKDLILEIDEILLMDI